MLNNRCTQDRPIFLIVDDEPDARVLLQHMLEALGCQVQCADSGKAALALLADTACAGKFGGIFLDIVMPDMTGFELLNKLEESGSAGGVPVIFVTAMDRAEDIIRGYNDGAQYYMTKPYSMDQLAYCLQLVFDPDIGEDPRDHTQVHTIEWDSGPEVDSKA